MTVDERYQRLEDTVRAYNPTASFDKIRAAYEFAAAAHQGQLRKDGSPFVTHPLAVAQIVAEELHLDSESIEAALLHDTIEDTSATHIQTIPRHRSFLPSSPGFHASSFHLFCLSF